MNKVVVVALTSVDLPGHRLAVLRTVEALPFRSVPVMVVPVEPIRSTAEYSYRVMADLLDYLPPGATHALLVQADGYGRNRAGWTDDFLDYDYVGAPWPEWLGGGVGNGGFSLRSIRWMRAARKLADEHRGEPEDRFCCVDHLKHFVRAGCRVAPPSLAQRFSTEHRCLRRLLWRRRDSFGFHAPKPLRAGRVASRVVGWILGPRQYDVSRGGGPA